MASAISISEKFLANRFGAGIFDWKPDELWSITGMLAPLELASMVTKLSKLSFSPTDESERELFNSLLHPAVEILIALHPFRKTSLLRDFLLLDETRLKDRSIEELNAAGEANTDDTLKQSFDCAISVHTFRSNRKNSK